MINLVHERTPMPEQSKDLRCKNFDEVALGYTPLEAVGEAMRCLNCREKPCVAGCPIHQQIPEFLARVAEGDFDGAYDVITQRSSLPAVCGRVCPQEQQCEKNCAHVRKGEAVAIGRLERFVADWHDAHTPISVPEVEKKGKKVAVIGSGPAGIACAGDLAALGYEVTVFEKLAYAGGILTYGIPTFVLPRSVVDRALKTLWAQGVEIVTGAPVDGARTVDDLFAAGYQAVFVGNGADVPQVPPGLDTTLAGVWTANDYLTQVNLHSGELPESIRAAKRVLVVGGGNVAVDAVRCARRLGRRPSWSTAVPSPRPPPAGMRSPTPTRRTSPSGSSPTPWPAMGKTGCSPGSSARRWPWASLTPPAAAVPWARASSSTCPAITW